MPEYLTPGVYYERVDAGPGITAVRTDITGFVGIAPRGPIDTPVPVQSWRQYLSYFGGFTGSGYLAYAVRAFFENGGRRCWVVRVASREPLGGSLSAQALLSDTAAKPTWQVKAYSAGTWGNDLAIWLSETHQAQTISIPKYSAPEYTSVASIAGFERGSHVRLTQGTISAFKVVSRINADEQQLIWVSPDHDTRLAYDAPLAGFNQDEPILVESVEYTIQVTENGQLKKIYEGLSLVPEHPRYGPALLQGVDVPQPNDINRTMPAAPEPIVIRELRASEDFGVEEMRPLEIACLGKWNELSGGTDGLSLLNVDDFIGEDFAPLDSDEVRERKKRGLRTLEEVSEVAILAVPDIHIQPKAVPTYSPFPECVPDPCLPTDLQRPKSHRNAEELPPIFNEDEVFRMQSAMIQQCEHLHDRIALLDAPYAASCQNALGPGMIRAWRQRFDSKYAALYYPWVRVVDPLRAGNNLTRDIPPSGYIAGQYADTDFTTGVHKAPANEALKWVQDVTVDLNDSFHGILNPLGINAIRSLGGRGIRVFGARTISSDADWKFVNVRRLLMMIEKAIDLSTQWAAFEPNDLYTRSKLTLSLTSFLSALWQKGALAGKAANEAFFVKCDEEINPSEERDSGHLLAVVGVAPTQPFEFVVLRIGRIDNAFEVNELNVSTGG